MPIPAGNGKFQKFQTNMQELRADAAAPVDRKGAGAVALSGHQGEHQELIRLPPAGAAGVLF